MDVSMCQPQRVFTDFEDGAQQQGELNVKSLVYNPAHTPVFSVSHFIYILVDDMKMHSAAVFPQVTCVQKDRWMTSV